jgi:hypothetical protein
MVNDKSDKLAYMIVLNYKRIVYNNAEYLKMEDDAINMYFNPS